MNAVSQLLRVLAILGAIAAGVLFYLTKGKTDTLTAQLGKANSAASSAKSDADKQIKDLQDQVTAAAADKDGLQKKVKAAMDEADLADQRFKSAKDSLDSTDTTIKEKDAKIADLSTQVADLGQKVANMGELTNRLASLESQIVSKNKQIADLMDQQSKAPVKGSMSSGTKTATASSTATETPVAPAQLSAASPAKIVQIDTNNWLLVLDVGTENGIDKDAQLYLKVGDQPLGTVIVRTSGAKSSICSVTSTDSMSSKDFAKIVTPGLKVDYQRAL
jgi:peptidoglycan hydrolase CwlO-like protein